MHQQLPMTKQDSTTETHTFVIYVPPDSKERIISYKELLQQEQDKFHSQQPTRSLSYVYNDIPPPLEASLPITGSAVNRKGKLKPQTLDSNAGWMNGGNASEAEKVSLSIARLPIGITTAYFGIAGSRVITR